MRLQRFSILDMGQKFKAMGTTKFGCPSLTMAISHSDALQNLQL
jgi:hypothetical protein